MAPNIVPEDYVFLSSGPQSSGIVLLPLGLGAVRMGRRGGASSGSASRRSMAKVDREGARIGRPGRSEIRANTYGATSQHATSANIGPHLAHIAQFLAAGASADVGRKGVAMGQARAKFDRISAEHGQDSTHCGPNSTEFGPNSAEFGPKSANPGRSRPGLVQIWPNLGLCPPILGRFRPKLGRNRPNLGAAGRAVARSPRASWCFHWASPRCAWASWNIDRGCDTPSMQAYSRHSSLVIFHLWIPDQDLPPELADVPTGVGPILTTSPPHPVI